jgi:hypothetical protein
VSDLPAHPETGDDTGFRPELYSTTGPPRWVKVSAVLIAFLIAAVLIMLLVGGNHGPGNHGPGRHTLSAADRGTFAGVTAPAAAPA